MSYPKFGFILAGEDVPNGSLGRISVLNPATEDVLADLPAGGAVEAAQAAQMAFEGFTTWAAFSALDRSDILRRAATIMRDQEDYAALIMTLEQGKPLAQALGEWRSSADLLDWYAEEARRVYGRIVPSRAANSQLSVHRRPVGPVAAFVPWNFPAWAAMQKIAPALAAGCSVVVKPSEETPATTWLIAKALLQAGLPPKAISVIWGPPAEIASTLIAAPEIRKVTLTGSVRVGRIIAGEAGRQLKPTTMELGGHAPVIVAEDADLQQLIPLAAQWKFRNAGQVCVNPTRFLVHDSLYDKFVEGLSAQTRAIQVGAGTAPEITMGPLATANQLVTTQRLIEDAVAKGARLAAGGKRIGNKGYFHEPTVLADMTPNMAAMNDEPFGPLALVMKVQSVEAALEEANRLPVGLGAYAFTSNRKTAKLISDRIETGMLGINTFALALPETPFSGVKHSGFGAEGGVEGLEAFLHPFLVTELF